MHLNALFLLGLILFSGALGGKLFQKLRIPQVVGYIVVGILLGQTGLKIIDAGIVEALGPFSYFALGIIGFMIGGELKTDVFRRYGRQFAVILLSEGMAAFFVVFFLVGFLGSFLLGQGMFYWALGLLLGAIASATAPAATTDVLWEYKTRGPLTTSILGIVALDDALALILFAIASSIAPLMLGAHSSGLFSTMARPVYEIGMSILLGVGFTFLLIRILKKFHEKEKVFVISLSTLLFALGLALIIKVDMLLVAMTIGMLLANWEPQLSKDIFDLIAGFAAPFYILFFVLVGAKFDLGHMTSASVLIAVIYVVGRTVGKMVGANWGAKISGAPASVAKYLPYCLFSQAGVAIGLSILASSIFPGAVGNSIIIIIALTTFLVQIIGPPCVKFAVSKAGEVGLDITQEDVLARTKIEQVIDRDPARIYDHMHIQDILSVFAANDSNAYPVVDKNQRLVGVVSLDGIRQSLAHAEVGDLIVAHDIMEPPVTTTMPLNSSLRQGKEVLDANHVDYLAAIDTQSKLVGFVERKILERFVSAKLIEAEEKALSLG